MTSEIVQTCGLCQRVLAPTDDVVQTEKIGQVHPVDGSTPEIILLGEWFHASCWGKGHAPFREIDRGPLAQVLARS